jgi:hypothetical protein
MEQKKLHLQYMSFMYKYDGHINILINLRV